MNSLNNNLPLIVIFGRPNVGKSTLFNCLSGKNHALVSDAEGTTRDSNINEVEWQGRIFTLVDTGGILDLDLLTKSTAKKRRMIKHNGNIEDKVQEQAHVYLEQADLILFVVDARDGLMPQDSEIGKYLKKSGLNKKTLLISNKADSAKLRSAAAEFNKLSLGEPISVSAATGSGTGDMLDEALKKLSENKKTRKQENKKTNEAVVGKEKSKPISVCIIGKPNVGKSSFLNAILGYERVIVSAEAHTTREPQNTEIIYKGKEIKIVDTAGISKKGQKTRELHKYGIEKSLNVIQKTDIVLLVMDISKSITQQDAKLLEEVFNAKKGVIMIANNWDLIPERDNKKYTEYIYGKLPFATWAPIFFTSALTGSKVNKILDLVIQLDENRKIVLSESQLSKFLATIVKIHAPAKGKGTKRPRIYEFKQYRSNPPKFELRIGPNDNLHFSYVRFIENRLREKFNFQGIPITLYVSRERKIHGQHDKENLDSKKPITEAQKFKSFAKRTDSGREFKFLDQKLAASKFTKKRQKEKNS